MMRLLFSCLLIVLFNIGANAQLNVQSKFFVYFQTEPAKEFYIKINNQTVKANSSGYLILPQIQNGTYKLIVGFPDKSSPEQFFSFIIDGKDKGYLIKNFGAEGWGLFDLQTMSVIKSITEEQANAINKPVQPVQPIKKPEPKKEEVVVVQPPVQEIKKIDTIAAAIIQPAKESEKKVEAVVNDKKDELKAVEKKAEAIVVEKKEEVVVAPIKKVETVYDSTASDFTKLLSKAANNPELLEKPKVTPPPVIEKKKDVVGLSSGTVVSQDNNGVVADFSDPENEGKKIRIFIPEPKATVVEKVVEKVAPIVEQKKAAVQEAKKEVEAVKEEKAVVIGFTGLKKLKAVKSDCKQSATEADFLELRKIMAEQLSDADMIKVAETSMKGKCFTTDQIKYLSAMFMSDAQKVNFFNAAVSNVSDAQNYYGLIAELKSDQQKAAFEQLFEQ